MKHFYSSRGAVVFLVVMFAWGIFGGIQTNPVEAASLQSPPPALLPQEADLSGVTLTLADLPAGFEGMPDNLLDNFRNLLEQINSAGGYSNAEMLNLVGYQRVDYPNTEYVLSFLLSPLSAIETLQFDQQLSDPEKFLRTTEAALSSGGFSDFELLPGSTDLGASSIGFTCKMDAGSITIEEDFISWRRKHVNAQIAIYYMPEGYQPTANVLTLGRTLDTRLEAAVGPETETSGGPFRVAGPLVPELTTYIPTPLDLSSKPSVIGTNLLLAALMMLPFAAAAELFTRTLAENEETLKRRFRPVDWIVRLQEWNARFFGRRLGKTSFNDVLKVLGVMFFYGFIFSLLDKTWNPFSLKGLVLFGSMTVAYGLVGVADDILQWRRIRRWGLPAELKVRPTNILLAALSTAASRILSLVPGLMFGTPEALETDEKQFDEAKRRVLLNISAVTFTVIGLVFWLPTIVTDVLFMFELPETFSTLLGGFEAILLVVFAVALENLFIQVLGFPGSFGHTLRRKSRWLWIGLLVLVAFIFYHTLINPRGELASALQEGNVILLLIVAAAFILFTFGMRIYFQVRKRRAGPPLPSAEFLAAAPLTPAAAPTVSEPEWAVMLVSPGREKQCPVCANTIKAEAKLCRYCRATFSVDLRGYCLTDHDIVAVTEAGKCARCGGDPADLHVESRLLQAPAVRPVIQASIPVASPAVSTAAPAGVEAADTKQCPACGQTIKAEARLCRYCKTIF